MTVPPIRRWRLKRPRTSLHIDDTNGYLRENAFLGLDLLAKHAGGVRGKAVCEIGPGDFLTSGLSMLAAGAERYAVIDKFPGDYAGILAKKMYQEVADNWDSFYPEIPWNPAIDPAKFPEGYGHLLELIGEGIESATSSQKFDILCSFQVGEHVSDINAFARMHDRLLKARGVGLHRVDFGPHDVWSGYQDPLTFLRFPEFLWKLTGANRGIPNRRRHHEFLNAFEKAGLKVDVLLTEKFDEERVDDKKWNATFRSMPKESVLVQTAIYRLHRE